MCGIVGAIAQRDVSEILLEGLRRLEYRGYDSAGVAIIDHSSLLDRRRRTGKVKELSDSLEAEPLLGSTGIAHTRWATHGVPSESNAHPHVSGNRVAIVHNGIIENHNALRGEMPEVTFESETDTEVAAHRIEAHLATGMDLLEAVQATVAELQGAFALGVICSDEPDRLIAARRGSPLVIGLGIGENFIASDVHALLPVTNRFIFLDEGDVAMLTRGKVRIYDASGAQVERAEKVSELSADAGDRGNYRHFMLKEIHEQPTAILNTLEGRIGEGRLFEECLGAGAAEVLDRIERVQIIACGTSYHAGLIARYWFEGIAGVSCEVEVASEYRYRRKVVMPNTLLVTISQSGETADTLAALREAKELGFAHTLTICNAPESSLVRESDLALMTRAGREIGVASTKAFTTQLVALMLLVIAVGRRHRLDEAEERSIIAQLQHLPSLIDGVLKLEPEIEKLAEDFVNADHALFLGRGDHYPVAMEGALKLKEISYIHAEAYSAGELKHGPLALVDEHMPVIAVAPNNELLEKLKSNLHEVKARGGRLYVFADHASGMEADEQLIPMVIAPVDADTAAVVYTVPLQLLAYHVAVLRGTDVNQPRNLAKSVTVE